MISLPSPDKCYHNGTVEVTRLDKIRNSEQFEISGIIEAQTKRNYR